MSSDHAAANAEGLPEDDEKVVTVEEMAAMTFEPWVKKPGDWEPPSFAEWPSLANPLLQMLWLGYELAHKSKDELVASVQASPELCTGLHAKLEDASRTFQGWAKAIDTASSRLICAVAAATVEAERSKGA